MPRKGEETRQRIVEAANDLFYRQGVGRTSFADIADSSGVPKGNFYFYFRSKNALLDAVIDVRLARIDDMLTGLEHDFPDPIDRLDGLVRALPGDFADIVRYGCSIGSLCAELRKGSVPSERQAQRLFDRILDWAAHQMAPLVGPKRADLLSRRLLARLQGMALMAHAFGDDRWITDELEDIRSWLRTLRRP